ncbi:Cytochrome P450 [Mycena venus]|uniref:Cytochrome P450 n=1 Tax=Mycena venus TaxID=2733690 RepID=A0A8H6Y1B3_9AGAR|nr:Cytochrome P450 [Mycena venus]
MTEQLEELSGSAADLCPILSNATLSAISEGMMLDLLCGVLVMFSAAALGYSLYNLGEEFISNNWRIMALSSNQTAIQVLADAIGRRLPKFISRAAIHFPTTTFKILCTAKYLAKQIGTQVIRDKMAAGQKGSGLGTDVFDIVLDQKKNALTLDELAAHTGVILLGLFFNLWYPPLGLNESVGGQDTTANALAFGLLELARHPEFQEKLRAEVNSSLILGSHSMAYDSIPLLNAFIKETLRLYPAEALAELIAVQDTIIPLTESIKTSTGKPMKEIWVRKGQILTAAVASYQRLESRWGEDAHEFRPSRWIDGTVSQGLALGPYANLLSFHGGPRTCLGWRFAISEMQVFFSESVAKFAFALPEEGAARSRFASSLMPVLVNGKKGVLLRVARIE